MNASSPLVRAPSEAELEVYARQVAESYVVDEAQARARSRDRGAEDHRVLVEDNKVRGGCFLHWMGIYLLGRRVPCLGVGAVCVPPASRSRGLARTLMEAVLKESRAEGYPLSALYPATQPLYRSVGYEQAGTWTSWEVPLAALGASRAARGDLDEIGPEEAPALLRGLYAEHARVNSGHLDRSDAIWDGILQPHSGTARVYAVREEGKVTGAAVVRARRTQGFEFDLDLTELLALTPSAVARLARFLEGHRSLGRNLRVAAGAFEPLFLVSEDVRPRVHDQWRFMLRAVDVPGALLARGWPEGARGELCFFVDDPLFEENAGPWRLRLEQGQAEVERGGAPRARLDVRALAALVGGGVTPRELHLAGLLDVESPDDEATLTRLFAGPRPVMRDFF